MMAKSSLGRSIIPTVALALMASACGTSKPDNASSGARLGGPTAQDAAPAETAAKALTLAQGPDICFRKAADHLGKDTKVMELTSFFSSGKEIDASDDEPLGQMTTCTVEYQNPADPRKVLGIRLDPRTGAFTAPAPVELSISSSDAASFKLDDYLIPLSSVDAAALSSIMAEQKARLDKVYSRYAWSGIRLMPPGTFENKPTLRLDVEGRLASNDLKAGGYASVTADGKKVTTNFLLP